MAALIRKIVDRLTKKGIISKTEIAKFLPSNPIIIEAGAYIGNDTKTMSRQWPDGFIHAFEPVPSIYSKLVRNVRRCNNVRCYPIALAKESGLVQIFISDGESTASSSLLRPKEHLKYHPKTVFQKPQLVESTTLDDWKRRYNIEKVDFLWLDTQGTELEIMKNAPIVMRDVSVIYTEVSLKEMYEGSSLYGELKRWLMAEGFVVKREELPWEDMGNVLFVRTSKR
ncbi:MAG: FkbM family methyltransferase [Bacteroidota bacterium]